MLVRPLPIADVQGVIVGAADGSSSPKRPSTGTPAAAKAAEKGRASAVEVLLGVDVDGLVLMQAARLHVLDLEDGVAVERVLQAEVDLLACKGCGSAGP